MDYNDLALNRHLDRLEENRVKEEVFNERVKDALSMLSLGEHFEEFEIMAIAYNNPDFDKAVIGSMNGSPKRLIYIIRKAVEYYITESENE